MAPQPCSLHKTGSCESNRHFSSLRRFAHRVLLCRPTGLVLLLHGRYNICSLSSVPTGFPVSTAVDSHFAVWHARQATSAGPRGRWLPRLDHVPLSASYLSVCAWRDRHQSILSASLVRVYTKDTKQRELTWSTRLLTEHCDLVNRRLLFDYSLFHTVLLFIVRYRDDVIW